MRTGFKKVFGNICQETVTGLEATSQHGPNDGIFLVELSRELVVLGARLQKSGGRLLELVVGSEELGLTRGQSGASEAHSC